MSTFRARRSAPPRVTLALLGLLYAKSGLANYDAFYAMTVNAVTNGDHEAPSIASDAYGNTVVVWADDSDGNGSRDIRMRIFGPEGREYAVSPSGTPLCDDPTEFTHSERRVNVETYGDQHAPRVAMNTAGLFVVAWLENGSWGTSTFAIRARAYQLAPDGSLTSLFPSPHRDRQLVAPQSLISADEGLGLDLEVSEPGDRFVVSWTPKTFSEKSRFQVFSTQDGTPQTSAIPLSAGCGSAGTCRMANVALTPNGNVLVAAEGMNALILQRFSSSGALQATVNKTLGASVGNPDLEIGLGGHAYATWEQYSGNVHDIGVMAFDTGLQGPLSPITLALPGEGNGVRQKPSIAVFETGDAVVAWQGDPDGNGLLQAHAVTVDATGSRSPLFALNPVADGNQTVPELTTMGDEFVAVWQDDNNIVRKYGETATRHNILRRIFDRATRRPPSRGDAFSLVLLPDTQNLTTSAGKAFCPEDSTQCSPPPGGICPDGKKEYDHPAFGDYAGYEKYPNLYDAQVEWILNHRAEANVAAVLHMGDMTAHNKVEQWAIARNAHTRMDSIRLPNTSMLGNHDYPETDEARVRNSSRFNFRQSPANGPVNFATDNFTPARYAWMNDGGPTQHTSVSSLKNDQSHIQFEAGGKRFSVISLEFAPSQDALCWAGKEIEATPNNEVIVVTHCHLNQGGESDCGSKANLVGATTAHDLQRELPARYGNVFLVLNGHANGSRHEQIFRTHMAPYTNLMVDFQSEPTFTKACTAGSIKEDGVGLKGRFSRRTGNGWLQTLEFVPPVSGTSHTVQVRTHSVADGDKRIFASSGGKARFYRASYGSQEAENTCNPEYAPHSRSFEVDLGTTESPSYEYSKNEDFSGYRDRTVASTFSPWDAPLPTPKTCSGGQPCPRVLTKPAMSGNGRSFVVVWEEDQDANGSYQISGRLFDKYGCETTGPFYVNESSSGHQRHPSVSMDPDGRFVVAWEEVVSGDSRIEARVFNPDGTALTGDLLVANGSLANGSFRAPSVAIAQTTSPNPLAGTFVVAWEDDSNGDGIFDVHARFFTASGNGHPAFSVHQNFSTGQQRQPSVGLNGNGTFAVAYADEHGGAPTAASVRLFGPLNPTVSSAPPLLHNLRRVSAVSGAGPASAPSVAINANGRVVVSWTETTGSLALKDVTVKKAVIDSGLPVLSTVAGSFKSEMAEESSVGLRADGSHFVAWSQASGGLSRIFAQRQTGPRAQVSTFWTDSGQNTQPSSYLDPDGNLFVAWHAKRHHEEILLRGMTPNEAN